MSQDIIMGDQLKAGMLKGEPLGFVSIKDLRGCLGPGVQLNYLLLLPQLPHKALNMVSTSSPNSLRRLLTYS